MLAFHAKHGKEGTLMVTRVDEPSKYGVVVHAPDGTIQHFVEKPQTFVGNHINAGLYLFSPAILSRIELRPTSIEKEIFPVMAHCGQLFAMELHGYWADIGQPKDYLSGQVMHLASLRKRTPAVLATGAGIKGDVLIHATAKVGEGCLLGPGVVVGEGCVIGAGVRLERTTLLGGVTVKDHAYVANSIIGWGSTLGAWTRVEGGAVLGEDVQVRDGVALNGAVVLPHKGLGESVYAPAIIM